MAGKSYRDLAVWQEAMALVTGCYCLARRFPNVERFGMTSQLQRAAISIPANIAEGRARRNSAEFRYHVGVARGSLAEVETYLELARNLKYAPESEIAAQERVADRTSRMLNGLYAALTKQMDVAKQKKAQGTRHKAQGAVSNV